MRFEKAFAMKSCALLVGLTTLSSRDTLRAMRNVVFILILALMFVSNARADEAYDDETTGSNLSGDQFADENGMITQQLAPPHERQNQVYPRKKRKPRYEHCHDELDTRTNSVFGAETTPNIPGAINAPNIPGAGSISNGPTYSR